MMLTSPMWRPALVIFSAVAILSLTACATTTASGGIECVRWKPILWSKTDTDETIRQVKEHNAVWSEVCRGWP